MYEALQATYCSYQHLVQDPFHRVRSIQLFLSNVSNFFVIGGKKKFFSQRKIVLNLSQNEIGINQLKFLH